MTTPALDLTGVVLRPDGQLSHETLSIADGVIAESACGRAVDLTGFLILPGIVDLHGDGFERHLAPRRGVMKDLTQGLIATDAELAANGISTAVLAQFWSWEGGLRGPDFARRVFHALTGLRGWLLTDIRGQLRLEINLLDDYAEIPGLLEQWGVDYVVFNDHLPHDRLAEGRRPKQLTGQALKSGRSPEAHWALMRDLHARSQDIPAALDGLTQCLARNGIRMGHHDAQTKDDCVAWHGRQATIAEFPETRDAAEAARALGHAVVMGAPNLVRGGSHKGNVSALDLVAMGAVDALASDYHYPSLGGAALMLSDSGVLSFGAAWNLISSGPARVMGLHDRGQLAPGQRADIVVMNAETRRIEATFCGGHASYMTGGAASRFLA